MELQTYTNKSCRYGFSGAENENSISGSGNECGLGLRFYYSRLGKMAMVDPRSRKCPSQSPFVYHRNNPIARVDYLAGEDLASEQIASLFKPRDQGYAEALLGIVQHYK